MTKFVIAYLSFVALSEAGLITGNYAYPHFPHLQTVYHGHGATSYQNVNVQNWGSVPIPKDLQVDDGHEYRYHSPPGYLHHQPEVVDHGIPAVEHYVDSHENSIVLKEAPYEWEKPAEHSEGLESQHHQYSQPSHYDHYDHEVEYEYH